jgi:hypothetical protein
MLTFFHSLTGVSSVAAPPKGSPRFRSGSAGLIISCTTL